MKYFIVAVIVHLAVVLMIRDDYDKVFTGKVLHTYQECGRTCYNGMVVDWEDSVIGTQEINASNYMLSKYSVGDIIEIDTSKYIGWFLGVSGTAYIPDYGMFPWVTLNLFTIFALIASVMVFLINKLNKGE